MELVRRYLHPSRLLWGGVILCLGLGLAWHLPSLLAHDDAKAIRPIPHLVPVETISLKALSSYRISSHFSGQVSARRSSTLGFERPGKLIAIQVDEGAQVTAGTPLAILDTQKLLTTQRQLQAKRDQANAQLQLLEAGPRRQTIAVARAQVQEHQAELARTRQRYQRRQLLWDRGVIAREELEAAKTDFATWQARLNAAERRLDELLAGTRPEQIEAQRALVAQCDAQLAEVAVELEKSVLKASFTGTIAARLADEGTVVSAGDPVLRLVEATYPEVRVGVPPDVAATLSVGSQQHVQIGHNVHQARIIALLPELDATTRTVTVRLNLLPTSPGVVIPGQVARLQLYETVRSSGFWLPITALTKGERGLWSCLALAPVDDNTNSVFRTERRSVEILHTEANRVFVRGVLQPGERVIKSGTHRIVAGQHVRTVS